MIYGYHFVGATLRDGSPVPPDGQWLEVSLPLKMCEHGLHGAPSALEALQYAPGATLCWCEYDGEILRDTDKFCAQRRRILARFDATELLRKFARERALSVIHLWKAPDVVRQYLETGDEALRPKVCKAAAYAADAAAYAASRTAANAAYANAAYAAAAYAAAYAADAAADAAYAASRTAANAAYAASRTAANAAYAAAYAADAAADAAAEREKQKSSLQAAVNAEFKRICG